MWPTYIGEKGRTLGKIYGIKVNCYREHPWGTHWERTENIENMMGTHWEREENMLGTNEKWKNPSPQPTQNSKQKKSRHFECMLSLARGHRAEQLKPHPNKLPFQLLLALKLSSLLWILPFVPKIIKKLSSWVMLSSAWTIQHLLSVLWVSVLISSSLLCLLSSKGFETC